MKATIVRVLLLLSLSFNITHAAFIAIEDDHARCHHTTAVDFVLEQNSSDDCGDLCKMHHLFHFMAILDEALPALALPTHQEAPQTKTAAYTPPFKTTEHKPPIYT